MLQESRENVESLINLAVCVNKLWVVHSKNIVDTDIYIYWCMEVFITEYWNFYSWHVAQSTWLSTFLYNFAAVFYQKVLVVGHSVMKNHNYVDIWPRDCPEPILTASSCDHCYFSVQNRGIIRLFTVIECLLNSFNNLVPLLKVRLFWHLLMINLMYESFSLENCALSLFWFETIQSKHHMCSTYLLVSFYLLALNALFIYL